jgi:Co/Zn/Cd efflux system component
MTSNNKHVYIKTKFSDEMYDCIQVQQNESNVIQLTGPQHLRNSEFAPTPPPISNPTSGNLHRPLSLQEHACRKEQVVQQQHNGHKQPNGDHLDDQQDRKIFLQGLEIDHQQKQSPRDDYHHHRHHHHQYDHHHSHHANDNRPSNENLLGTAFCSFMTFASIQTVVAIFAKSEAMLGDSAAMIVDSLTYLFNWYAERKKAHFETEEWATSLKLLRDIQDDQERQRILARTRRKYILKLELIPPMISVSTLIVVTAFVSHKAIRILILDVHRSISLQGNPNIHIMKYFSIANLGLDLVNVLNFAKAKHLFGYETNDTPRQGHEALQDHSQGDHHICHSSSDDNNLTNLYSPTNKGPPCHQNSMDESEDDDDDDEDQDHTANLNMCSAYTVCWCWQCASEG